MNLHPDTIYGNPGAYLNILNNSTQAKNVDFIIELGSRDAVDAIKINRLLEKKIYSFECNPQAIEICKRNLNINKITKDEVELIELAAYSTPGPISFYATTHTPKSPFGKRDGNLIEVNGKKANIGTSSIYKFNNHWSKIHHTKEISVQAETLDRFINSKNLKGKSFLLLMDIQGAEMDALEGAKNNLHNCKLIIAETEKESRQYNIPTNKLSESIIKLLSESGFSLVGNRESGDLLFKKND